MAPNGPTSWNSFTTSLLYAHCIIVGVFFANFLSSKLVNCRYLGRSHRRNTQFAHARISFLCSKNGSNPRDEKLVIDSFIVNEDVC